MNFVPFGQQLGISALNRALAQSPSSNPAPRIDQVIQRTTLPSTTPAVPPPAPVAVPVSTAPIIIQPMVHRLAQGPTMLPREANIGGEPNLNAALENLSDSEAADFRGWGYKERIQFLNGYQFLSTMVATGLRRPDGTGFQGAFPRSIDLMTAALQAASPYFKTLDAENAKAAEQAATVLQDGTKAEPKGQDLVQKYLLLRDRVAWELANGDAKNPDPDKRFPPMTIRYEVLGTDQANTGILYSRTIGTTPNDPDLIIEYSTMSPRELWNEGLRLEGKYEDLGVSFKKLDMSGANLRMGAGPLLILGIIMTAIVALLSAWWLWDHITTKNKLLNLAIENIQKDPRLSPAQKAKAILDINNSANFFSEIFGYQFPWETLIISAAVVGIAYFGIPMLLDFFSGSKEKEKAKSRKALRPSGATA